MIGRIFTFAALIIGFFFVTSSVSASTAPVFPTCDNPQGSVLANYSDGTHGIVGDSTTHTGSDAVYGVSNNQALQCYCGQGAGIQTNWWKVGEMSFDEVSQWGKQGWVYIPDGSQWGLSPEAYLAYNTNTSCGGNPGNPGNPSNPSAPICTDTVPGSAPVITNIIYDQNTATLTWTKAVNPVNYYLIAYGTTPGNYKWGNPNVGNVTTYTITRLSGGQIYYFAVRAGNGCKPGPFSNEVSTTPTGGFVQGAADGFTPNVLGTSDPATSSATLTKTICANCFWWPILLGEIVLLTILYLIARKKNIKIHRLLLGGVVALLAYVIFLLMNKGHVCPDGSITLWIFSLPCKYFWVFDLVIFAILSWIIRSKQVQKLAIKTVSSKKSK